MAGGSISYRKEDVLHALNNILESAIFRSSPRARDFLNYVVIETLEGRADRLSGTTIGQDVFRKGACFESSHDALVRVSARRLRSKLRDYYLDQQSFDLVILTMPKGSYKVEISSNENKEAIRQQLIRQSDRQLTLGLRPP